MKTAPVRVTLRTLTEAELEKISPLGPSPTEGPDRDAYVVARAAYLESARKRRREHRSARHAAAECLQCDRVCDLTGPSATIATGGAMRKIRQGCSKVIRHFLTLPYAVTFWVDTVFGWVQCYVDLTERAVVYSGGVVGQGLVIVGLPKEPLSITDVKAIALVVNKFGWKFGMSPTLKKPTTPKFYSAAIVPEPRVKPKPKSKATVRR